MRPLACVDMDSRLIGCTQAEGSKLFLAEEATEIYDQAIQTALRLYDLTGVEAHKQTAFQFAEKSKAGILLEALAEAEASGEASREER